MQAAQRGAVLTQRMLAFARRQILNPVSVHIPTLVNGMTDMLDRSLGANITIAARFPSAIGAVMVDRDQLEMAVLNLALNARDWLVRVVPETMTTWRGGGWARHYTSDGCALQAATDPA